MIIRSSLKKVCFKFIYFSLIIFSKYVACSNSFYGNHQYNTTASQQAINDTTSLVPVSRGGTGLTSLTAHNLLVGNNTSPLTLISPSAVVGMPLVSKGALVDPNYEPAVVQGGGTGAIFFTNHGVLLGEGTSPIAATAVGTNGQVLLGSTGADPVFATPTSTIGTINFTQGAGSLAFDVNTGLRIVTGFESWGGSGSFYDDTVVGSFTVLRSGTGYINAKPVSWTAPQTITGLVSGVNYFIYIDDTGTLQKESTTTATTSTFYQNNIILFNCLRDATTATNVQYTIKRNRRYQTSPGTTFYVNNIIGSLIENNNGGANIAVNGTQALQINGADVVNNAGISTTIPDSAATPITISKMYTNVSGLWARDVSSTTFTGNWNNAGTVTALSAGRYAVYTVYVTLDSLNSTAPQYFAVLDTADYASSGAANTAISNGTVAKATNELLALSMTQLGYVIYEQSSSSIVQVIVEKTTLRTGVSSSGTNIASLITTNTTAFDGILSAADTNVQASLNTIDEWGKSATNRAVLIGRGVNTPIASVAPSATAGIPLISQGSSADPIFSTALVAGGGTGATTLTQYGVLVGNGNSQLNAVAPSATVGIPLISQGSSANPIYSTALVAGGGTGLTSLTAHNLIIGNNGSTPTLLAPSATAGIPLVSSGSSANPAYSTAVVQGGGTGATSLTAHGVLLGEGTSPIVATAVGTNGQVLLGSTGADPVFATPTSTIGTINFTQGAGSLAFDVNTGLRIVTGFESWGGSGSFYDDTVVGSFTVLRSGTGYINAKPVSWTAPQTITGLVSGVNYFIYIDDTGTLQKESTTTANTATFYQNNIILFNCLRDATTATNVQHTIKRNRRYQTSPGTTFYVNNIIGSLIENNNGGANIALNGTQALQINGADAVNNAGISTVIPDSAATPITISKMYTNASGLWARDVSSTTFTGNWNNAGTVTALSAGRYAVYTVYVTLDSLNSTAPQYFAVLDTADYASSGAANTAISNGTVAKATNELLALSMTQLGYVIYEQSSSSIVQVIVEKTTLRTGVSSSGTNIASLITTNTSAFDGILSAADTNVQLSLNTIDEWGKNATNHAVLIGQGVNTPIVGVGPGTSGQILVGSTSADPSFVTPTAGSGLSVTTNSSTLQYAISAPVSVSNGGIGTTSLTAHGVLLGEGTSPIAATAVGTNGQVLLGSTGADPVFATPTSTIGTINFTQGAGSLAFDVNTGLRIVTGFESWGGSGSFYDDTVVGSFTVLRSGTGYINAKPVSWTAPQTITGLVSGVNYFIYIDDTGTLQKESTTTATTSTFYQNNIILFNCLRDATTATNVQYTIKRNRRYQTSPGTTFYVNNIIGSLIENNNGGANIAVNGTQALQINGADVVNNAGISTTIPDSAATPITISKMYTNVSGLWARDVSSTTFTGNWNNAGTVTALSAGRYAVYTVYVTLDSLNSTAPQYFAVLDTADYASSGAANTAISNGTVAKATNELLALSMTQLGYVIYEQSSSSIVQVIVEKTTLRTGVSSSGTNIASLITTNTSAFDGILSAADTNVQASLNTIDEWGKSATNHAVLIGKGVNTPIASVAPSATAGIPLISQGSSADPIFSTALVAGGGTGATTLTQYGVLIGNATSAIAATSAGATGTILTGNTGANPSFSATPSVTSISIANAPVAGTDGVNKSYVDLIASGLTYHAIVVAATTVPLTATYTNGTAGVGATLTNAGTLAAFSIDGQFPTVSQRVLIKDQASTFQNGVYTVTVVGDGSTAWVLTRATDFNNSEEITQGDLVPVYQGTLNGDSFFVQNSIVTSIGVDPITFSLFLRMQLTGNSGSASGSSLTVSGGSNISTSGSGSTLTVSLSGTTNHAVQIGNSVGSLTSLPVATNGQVLLGSTSSDPSFITPTAGTGLSVTSNASTLQYALSTPVSVVNGGTERSSLTAFNLILGNGTSAPTLIAPSTTVGIPLVSQGNAANPAYSTAVVAGGGTGLNTLTAYALLTGGTTATGALQQVLGLGTSGQVLTSNGAGALPTWQTSGASAVQSVTVNLTNSQIRNLGGTSIQLVAAPGAGQIINILSAVVKLNQSGAAFTGTGNIGIGYATAPAIPAAAQQVIANALTNASLDAASNQIAWTLPAANTGQAYVSGTNVNTPVVAFKTTAAVLGGNASNATTMSIIVTYQILTI